MYCFPESWDAAAGRTEDNDYRNSRPYQMMLANCAGTNYNTHVMTFLRRQFFGISDHWAPKRNGYGKQPIKIFVNAEVLNRENPGISDGYLVRGILMARGLPVELAVKIMKFAHHEAKRRLTVPHDPFNSSNREELVKYLNYCWELLACCEMTAQALRQATGRYFHYNIDWSTVVFQCINRPWGLSTAFI